MPELPVLVGQYDSPFVRRVAVAMHHYGVAFRRRVLSTFADFDAMLELSPFGKVPVLILPDGERLWDSRAILDFLHSQVASDDLLLSRAEPERRRENADPICRSSRAIQVGSCAVTSVRSSGWRCKVRHRSSTAPGSASPTSPPRSR